MFDLFHFKKLNSLLDKAPKSHESISLPGAVSRIYGKGGFETNHVLF